MKMKILFRLCFIFLFGHHVHSNPDFSYDIDMIVDFIGSSERPTSVVAHVCWKPSKKVKMMNRLMNMNSPKTVRFVDKNWINGEPMNKERVLVLTDINCHNFKEFLEIASATKKLAFPYRWLILGKSVNESSNVSPEIYNLHMLTDSEVLIAQKNDMDSFVLSMIYKMNINGTWESENIGYWCHRDGLRKSELSKSSISTRRNNFNMAPIITALVTLDNKTRSDPYALSGSLADAVTKSSFRSTYPIYQYLNATYDLVFSDTWGYNRNGTYGGMIADLTVGDAELAGSVLMLTEDRMKMVDYLSCPMPIPIKFVFRPPPLSYQNNLFLLPFKATVWCCIGAFVVIFIFILHINAFWESKKLKRVELNSMDPTALEPRFSDITVFVISAISQQGSSTELKGTLGRTVMFLLFLVFLLLFSAYAANIVALLQSSSNQIRTLSDLLNSKMEMGVQETPYNRYFFSVTTEPVRKAIYETKIAPKGKEPKFMSLEEGVKKLQNEAFAFNMNLGIGYHLVEKYFLEHEKCGLQEIGYLLTTKPHIVCRKDSPYKEMFKIGLFRIKEHGMCGREDLLIYARKPACVSRGGSFDSVNMVDVRPVLLMYLYGILLAFLLLIVEIMVHRNIILRQFSNRSV